MLARNFPAQIRDQEQYSACICNYYVVTKMNSNMEIPVIQIGNSKGIRLAKSILERYQITEAVELIFEEGFIIIKPAAHLPRSGWEDAFKAMHEQGDDALLIDDVFEDETLEEWQG
jgi:antitoxin MazE